ncbi:hypothetical protein N9L29_02615 [Litoricolaceae bacterium]|nr:hypothetical protein [Litorivicinaceae bacterium]
MPDLSLLSYQSVLITGGYNVLTIKRLGRRSFEVFRLGVPVGIVRFLKEAKVWSFRPYPTPDASSGLVEKSDKGLRNLLCPAGERCTVDRTVEV